VITNLFNPLPGTFELVNVPVVRAARTYSS